MTEKEIKDRFQQDVRKYDTQVQCERVITAINDEQTRFNRPYLDRLAELQKAKALLEQQKQAIFIQLDAIRVERIDIEQKRKLANRAFYDLKHELILLNPREKEEH